MWNMRYSYQNVMKFEICRQILEKYKKRNIMKISPVGAESLHADRQTDRQTDRHDEANYGFSQFFERA